MESHKTSTIAYALGFITDYVEQHTEPLVEGDEETLVDDNNHREQVRAMMEVLNKGTTQLMAENGRLLNKIASAELALKS